jgi:hypothetical protein
MRCPQIQLDPAAPAVVDFVDDREQNERATITIGARSQPKRANYSRDVYAISECLFAEEPMSASTLAISRRQKVGSAFNGATLALGRTDLATRGIVSSGWASLFENAPASVNEYFDLLGRGWRATNLTHRTEKAIE